MSEENELSAKVSTLIAAKLVIMIKFQSIYIIIHLWTHQEYCQQQEKI